MKYCPKCNKDYPKYVDECTRCNIPLVEDDYEEDYEEEYEQEEDDGMYIQGVQSSLIKNENCIEKKNFVGIWLKILAVLLAMGSLGGSAIKSYVTNKKIEYDTMGAREIGYHIVWKDFIFDFCVYFGACILLCGFLFAMGEIINLLQKLYNNQKK